MADETATLAAPVHTTDDWRASLPEDLRAEKSLESFKDVGALAKSYVETKQLVGTKIPEGLTPESVKEYLTRKAEGPPDTPAGYQIKSPVFPKEYALSWDADLQARYLEKAHAAGLSNKAAQDLIEWYAQEQIDDYNRFRTENAAEERAAEQELRRHWGSAYGPTMGNVRQLQLHMTQMDPKIGAAFEAKGNDPHFMRGLAYIADMMVSRGEIRGDEHRGGRTVEEITAEIERIRNDPKSANDMTAGDRILALTRELLAVRDRQK